MRLYFTDQFQEFIIGITFYIEFCGYNLFKIIDILVPDMSLVWSWMYGDSLGAETFAIFRNFENIRIIAPTIEPSDSKSRPYFGKPAGVECSAIRWRRCKKYWFE